MFGKKLVLAAAITVVAGAASAQTYVTQNVTTRDAGTTARFGSAIQTPSAPVGWPAQQMHLYRGDTGSVRFRLENTAGAVDFAAVSGNMDFFTGGVQQMRLMASGNLGIGTTAPAATVHVNRAVTSGVRLRLQNSEGNVEVGTDGGNYQLTAGGSVRMTVLANGRVGIGTAAPTQPLDVAGVGRVQILEITGGSDLSEQFNVTAAAETHAQPGMVVCIDPARPGELVVSSKPYDFTVAGIISGAGGVNSGMIMGQQGSVADGAHPVALTGRVYCYVDATLAAVQPGDLLTTSVTPGHAMKVLDHSMAQGSIIGKAMTPLAAGEKGLVLVLVTLQ